MKRSRGRKSRAGTTSRKWTFVVTKIEFRDCKIVVPKASHSRRLIEQSAATFVMKYPAAAGAVSIVKGHFVKFMECSFRNVEIAGEIGNLGLNGCSVQAGFTVQAGLTVR